MRTTAKLGATSKPASRGSATSSSAASSDTLDESYKYGKKRGRGFLTEESSDSEDSSKEEEEPVTTCIRKLYVPIYSSFFNNFTIHFLVNQTFCSNLLEYFNI